MQAKKTSAKAWIFLIIFFIVAVAILSQTKKPAHPPGKYPINQYTKDIFDTWITHNLIFPPSQYQSESWSEITLNADGTEDVTHSFIGTDEYGRSEELVFTFKISGDGNVISTKGQ